MYVLFYVRKFVRNNVALTFQKIKHNLMDLILFSIFIDAKEINK